MPITLNPAFLSKALLSLTLSSLALSTTTYATDHIEEVIIYSSLDNRSLSQLAASISLLDEGDIKQRNAQHIDQLLATAPNVNFSGGASRGRFVQIRGIGDIEQFVDPKAYPSVGLIVDGIELNGIFGAGLLFDTEQVEILRGPQGTRFGAAALAGAINIVSARPTQEAEGFIELGYGDFNSRQAGTAIGGALTKELTGRISVNQYRSDGYIDNDFLNKENTGRFDEFTAKTRLEWKPNDDLQLGLTALHIDNNNGYDAFSLNNTQHTTFSDESGHDKQRVSAYALDLKGSAFGNAQLETKITYLGANLKYAFDEDWTDPTFCNPPTTCPFGGFSGFDAYQRDRQEYTFDTKIIFDTVVVGIYTQNRETLLNRNHSGDTLFSLNSDYDTDRQAVYGQWTPSITHRLNASLGARFEKFSDNYKDSNNIQSDSDDNLRSFEASLSFDVSEKNTLFALVSRGNKAGGVNTDASTNIATVTPPFQAELINRLRYKSESLTNIEVGNILQSNDGDYKLRLTAFYNQRNSPQFETFLYDAIAFAFVGYQDNADSAESHGLELQIDMQLGKRLTVQASVAYIDSSIKNFRAYDLDKALFVNLDKKQQPRASNYQYHIASTLKISDKISATLQLEGRDSYQFAYYFDEESGNVNLAHANIEFNHKKLQINLWARNLLDEEYPVQGLYFGNDPRDGFINSRLYTQAGEPRNIGATLRINL